jgi:hypothetical protein
MPKGVVQSIPILVILALYAYLFWFFTFEMGFFRLTPIIQVFVILTLLPFPAGAWLILGEPEGWIQVPLVLLLIALPLLYLGLLILLVVLHVI